MNMNRSLIKFSKALALPLVMAVAAPSLFAQQATTDTWTGATDDNWNVGTNWSNAVVPGAASNAGILNGASVDILANPISAISQLLVNGTSTLDISAALGITTSANEQGFYSGANGSAGTINILNGGAVTQTGGNFGVGRGTTGLLTIAEGGSFSSSGNNEFHLGWDGGGTGTVTQTGGTFTKTGGGDTRIGAFGGSGIYNISGGTASINNLRVSFAGSGTGTINQSGGTVNNTGEMALGWASTGDAVYNLTSGSLVSSQRMRFGIGNGVRNNTFNQSGGSVTITNGRVDIGEEAGPTNTYNISGGTLAVNGDGRILVGAFGGSNGTLNVSGTGSITTASSIALGETGTAKGTLNLNGGTVTTTRIFGGSSSVAQTVNWNGGKVVAKASEGNFIAKGTGAFVVDIKAGGAVMDTAGFDIGIPASMSGVGSLTKLGSGASDQLKLIGANTYEGNTYVDAGLLTLIDNGSLKFVIGATGVNNQITSNLLTGGSVNLFGDFVFDLTNAAGVGIWPIIDYTKLTSVSFAGDTFTVPGFTDQGGGIWTKEQGGNIYTFDRGTGFLIAAIPEPGTIAMAIGGIGVLCIFRRRKANV